MAGGVSLWIYLLKNATVLIVQFLADVAQLVRASDCGSEGRGFKSHHSPQNVLSKRLLWRGLFILLETFVGITHECIRRVAQNAPLYVLPHIVV